MVVKGLPDSYKPFVVHIVQTNDTVTFGEFKTKLRSYESTEKYGKSDVNVGDDNVMRISGETSRGHEEEERKWTWLMLSVTRAVKRDTWPGHVLTNTR